MVVAEAVDVVVVAEAVDVAAVAAEAAVAAVAAVAAAVSEAAAYRGASAVFADPRRALLASTSEDFWPGSGSDPANSCAHHRSVNG
jgi:hypothetical protein